MASRTTLVLLASAVLLAVIGMQSGAEVALAWTILIAAMGIELAAWKRGLDRARATVTARRARRHQR